MYTLFNMDLNIQTPTVRVPDWIYISDTIKRGVGTFVNYYHTNSVSIKSNHLLVRLLQSINVPKSLELNRFYDSVDSLSSNLSMALKFTSSINKGEIFNNVFYGEQSSEIIISYDAPFDLVAADKNWRNISAVKVIKHDRSSLDLSLLDGKANYGKEISVISINIPLLAVQYRAFRNNENIVNIADSQRSAMQFVAMYVLPNMVYSHLDYVIFNRIYNLLFGIPNDAFIVRTPFFQTDYSQRVDKVLNELVGKFKTTKLRFDAILKSIPAISNDNLFKTLELPEILPTRQVLWALVTSRVRALDFLFTLNNYSESEENQNLMNKIIRQAIFYRSDNTLKYGLTPNIYLDVQNTIDRLESMAKQQ